MQRLCIVRTPFRHTEGIEQRARETPSSPLVVATRTAPDLHQRMVGSRFIPSVLGTSQIADVATEVTVCRCTPVCVVAGRIVHLGLTVRRRKVGGPRTTQQFTLPVMRRPDPWGFPDEGP